MSLLIGVTLKSSFILVCALAALRTLRGSSAATRHVVLAAAMAAALMLPAAQPLLPAINVNIVPAPVAPVPSVDMRARASAAARLTPAPFLADGFGPVADAAATPVTPVRIADILLSIWFVGVALSLTVLATGCVRLWWLTSDATRLDTGPWVETAADIAREYGIRRDVAIVQSTHPALLVTYGWRRPRIVLPADAHRWDADRIRVVLAHELAHIRRADWAVQLGAELLRSAYWFNPIVWIACRKLRNESERACDDTVLRRGVEGPEYAWHLLHLARAFKRQPATLFPAPAIARPSSLEQRIGAMLDPRVSRRPMTRRGAALTAAALVLLTLPLAALQSGPASFTGRILNPAGDPAAGGRVVLSRGVGMPAYEQRAEADGRFTFTDVPAGTYRLDVWGGDNARRQRPYRLQLEKLGDSLTLRGGDRIVRDITLPIGPISISTHVMVNAAGAQIQPRDRGFPVTWQCLAGLGIASFCGPPSMLEEFERDFEEEGSLPRDVRMPRLVYRPVPQYPVDLLGSGVEGTVTFEGVVGTDGFISGLDLVGADHPDLVEPAVSAARQMRWEPARIQNVPTEIPIRVDVEFEVAR